MALQYKRQQNPAFNPFESTPCWVIEGDLVRVEREVNPSSTTAPVITFRKVFYRYSDGRQSCDLTPFIDHEVQVLWRLQEQGVRRIVQLHRTDRGRDGRFDEVSTYDAGPSLDSWWALAQPQPTAPGERTVQPLAQPVLLGRVMLGVLEALQQVHRVGVVHCDVREGNVCLPFKTVAAMEVALAPPAASAQPSLAQAHAHASAAAIVPAPEALSLIDFAFALRPDRPLPAALPVEARARDHSPQFQAALRADAQRGDGQPQAVSRMDGRIDLHAAGLMLQRLLDQARRRSEWWRAPEAAAGDPLLEVLAQELLQHDTVEGLPMAADLHDELMAPLRQWLARHEAWQPRPVWPLGLVRPVAAPAVPDAAAAEGAAELDPPVPEATPLAPPVVADPLSHPNANAPAPSPVTGPATSPTASRSRRSTGTGVAALLLLLALLGGWWWQQHRASVEGASESNDLGQPIRPDPGQPTQEDICKAFDRAPGCTAKGK